MVQEDQHIIIIVKGLQAVISQYKSSLKNEIQETI